MINNKKILYDGTPMKDQASEIMGILNLILHKINNLLIVEHWINLQLLIKNIWLIINYLII